MEQIIAFLLGAGATSLVLIGKGAIAQQTKLTEEISEVNFDSNLPEPYRSIYKAGLRKGEMSIRDLMRMTLPAIVNADRNRAVDVYGMLTRLQKCGWVKLTPGKSHCATRFIAIPGVRGEPIQDRATGF